MPDSCDYQDSIRFNYQSLPSLLTTINHQQQFLLLEKIPQQELLAIEQAGEGSQGAREPCNISIWRAQTQESL